MNSENSANLKTNPNYWVNKRILATWIRRLQPGILLFQLALSDVWMCRCACTLPLCIHRCTYIQTQGSIHTELITSVSSSWYLHACFCLNAHILTTHWVQYAESEVRRAGLSKLPKSLCLSRFQEFHENFWLQTTTLEETNPLTRYDSFLQKIKSKDKLTSCLQLDVRVLMPTNHFEF